MKTVRLRWMRIVFMAMAIGLPVSLAALAPLAQQALEERRRSALEARYEDGLSPCHPFQLDDYELLRDELPRAGVSAMMVFPSFSDPYAISVSGDAAYYLQMDLVRNVNVGIRVRYRPTATDRSCCGAAGARCVGADAHFGARAVGRGWRRAECANRTSIGVGRNDLRL